MSRKINTSRRTFLKASAVASVGFWAAGGVSAQESRSANEKINFASIGVGGKGRSDSEDAGRAGNMVAICDVDGNTLGKAGDAPAFKNAKRYTDFRKMFDEMSKSIDAVTVSTPDHTHAPAALRAMREGKACFCQKPMTHSIEEARMMADIAREKNLATQMGNQGTANSALREAAALVQSGKLGVVKEVYVWTNRPVWPQGLDRPEEQPIPAGLDWDSWIGPAEMRPYNAAYHPFKWRGFWAFGTGALGDMACHTLNMPYMALALSNPTTLVAETSGHNKETFPKWSIITYEFPANDKRGPVTFKWYDGGKRPSAELLRGETAASGALVIGEKGQIYSGDDYCGSYKLWDMDKPEVEYERSPGHFEEFVRAIKSDNKEPARSNFADYAGGLTETVLLGNLAVWADGKKVEWDAKSMSAANMPELDSMIRGQYRKGWDIHV